jgi:hypothetical protein
MAETEAAVLVLRSEVVATVIDGGAVLLNLDTNCFYEVNATGWAILQLFEGGARRDQAKLRCEQWGAAADDAAVAQFLDVLAAENLVASSDWPASTADVTLAGTWSVPTIEKAPEALHRIMGSALDPTLPLAE